MREISPKGGKYVCEWELRTKIDGGGCFERRKKRKLEG